MPTGKIKTLVRNRGFGFIQVEGGSEEVFFHTSALPDGGYDALNENDTVEFEIEADPRNASRKRATNVRVTA